MTRRIHLANTDIEFELARSTPLPLEKSWARHSLCLQFQFLPLLYADANDIVAVTAFPSKDYLKTLMEFFHDSHPLPQLLSLESKDFPHHGQCLSWGPSLAIKNWAKEHDLNYEMPENWEMIREINSKAFSFQYTSLPEAALLFNEKELSVWLEKVPGKKLLKTCFGLSGQGHRRIEGSVPSLEILKFCRQEWEQKRPLLGEPWLTRLFDFSTQWVIHPDRQIEFLGATRFQTTESGQYQGSLAGPESLLFSSDTVFLNQHRQLAQYPLKKMAQKGFFGHVGVDAFVYQDQQSKTPCLYPIVEINARKTLSFVALRLQKRLCSNQIFSLSFSFDSALPSLLPSQIEHKGGKILSFRKKLVGKVLDKRNEV